MSIKYSLLVFELLVGIASGAGFERVLQMQNEETHMIAAGHSNYAISSPLLANTNWETLTVNGNNLLAISPNCSRIELTFDELSDEQRELIGKIMRPFEDGAVNQSDPNLIVEFDDAGSRIRLGQGVSRTEYTFGKPGCWFMLETLTHQNMLVSLGWLGRVGISRVFYVHDTVTIVYTDGRVKTEPRNCLQKEDSLLLREITIERKEYKVRRAQEKLQESLAEAQRDAHELV